MIESLSEFFSQSEAGTWQDFFLILSLFYLGALDDAT